VCAVGSLIALLGDWTLHGLPDSNYFATSRTACLSVYLIDPLCALDEGMPTAMDLTILVIVPLTIAVLASWFTGRMVAGWYAGQSPKRDPIRACLRVCTERRVAIIQRSFSLRWQASLRLDLSGYGLAIRRGVWFGHALPRRALPCHVLSECNGSANAPMRCGSPLRLARSRR